MKLTLEIKNPDDRKTVAAILFENGYTVRLTRIKNATGKATKILIEAEKEG